MQECEWLILDATSCRSFHIGQIIRLGDYLGRNARSGRRVRSAYCGEIIGIEYDLDANELILQVLPENFSTGAISSIVAFSSDNLPVCVSA
jgi:hypothetical protein